MENGYLHSWEDLPSMVRLYFKISSLDAVRPENFKVKYRQGHMSVAITWPHHLRQTIDVGPFTEPVDSRSIVVSRKGEQVVVSMAKAVKSKWNLLTLTGDGYGDIRIDHKLKAVPLREKNHEVKLEREASKKTEVLAGGASRKAFTPSKERARDQFENCIEFHADDAWKGKTTPPSSNKKSENTNYLVSKVTLSKNNPTKQPERSLSRSTSKNKMSSTRIGKPLILAFNSEHRKSTALPLKSSLPYTRRSIEHIIRPDSKKHGHSQQSQLAQLASTPRNSSPAPPRSGSSLPIRTASSSKIKPASISRQSSTRAKLNTVTTESTRDSEAVKGDSVATKVMALVGDKSLKARLQTYAKLTLKDKVELQRETIEAVGRVLREERAKRLACEQRFEQILLADSRRIGELVGFVHPGRVPQRISAPKSG